MVDVLGAVAWQHHVDFAMLDQFDFLQNGLKLLEGGGTILDSLLATSSSLQIS